MGFGRLIVSWTRSQAVARRGGGTPVISGKEEARSRTGEPSSSFQARVDGRYFLRARAKALQRRCGDPPAHGPRRCVVVVACVPKKHRSILSSLVKRSPHRDRVSKLPSAGAGAAASAHGEDWRIRYQVLRSHATSRPERVCILTLDPSGARQRVVGVRPWSAGSMPAPDAVCCWPSVIAPADTFRPCCTPRVWPLEAKAFSASGLRIEHPQSEWSDAGSRGVSGCARIAQFWPRSQKSTSVSTLARRGIGKH